MVYSTDRSKAVVPVLALLFLALWFILRGDLLYVFPCVILFLCFSVLLVLRLPRTFHTFVRFVLVWICRFPLPLGSGKGCVLWLWPPWTFLLPFLIMRPPVPEADFLSRSYWYRSNTIEGRMSPCKFQFMQRGSEKSMSDRFGLIWEYSVFWGLIVRLFTLVLTCNVNVVIPKNRKLRRRHSFAWYAI